MVAASKNVEILSKTKLLQQVKKNEKNLRPFLEHLKKQYFVISDVRGVGHLWGIEIAENKKGAMTKQIHKKCLDAGLLLRIASGPKNVLVLKPPLITSQKSFSETFDILDKVLGKVVK